MTASILDLAAYSQRKRASHSAYPALDIDLVVLATERQRTNETPAKGNGRLRIVINADDSWDLQIKRADERKSLLLRGDAGASAPAVLREMADWLFGWGQSPS
jgi:hypothetical protein